MSIIFKLLLFCGLGVLLVYILKKLVASMYNLYELRNGDIDTTKHCKGCVFNNKTNKMEEDQSVILPF